MLKGAGSGVICPENPAYLAPGTAARPRRKSWTTPTGQRTASRAARTYPPSDRECASSRNLADLLKLARVRFLLADDAGAGKTIMAGLLIRELQLRGLAERILIVAPSNLASSGSASYRRSSTRRLWC